MIRVIFVLVLSLLFGIATTHAQMQCSPSGDVCEYPPTPPPQSHDTGCGAGGCWQPEVAPTPDALFSQPLVCPAGQFKVNVRYGPGTDYGIVDALRPGSCWTYMGVNPIPDPLPEWIEVGDGVQQGWVSTQFTDLISSM